MGEGPRQRPEGDIRRLRQVRRARYANAWRRDRRQCPAALLGIVFKPLGLPEGFPQARFCLWLRKNGIYEGVRGALERQGRDFRGELNDLYVSPLIARALPAADPTFAGSEKEARQALRKRFPKPTRHLSELSSLAGNEQLLAILDRHDVLVANANEWTAAETLAVERLPAFQRLEALLRHAESLDVTKEVEPQTEAIVAGRRLLDASDPVPGIAKSLVDALRTAVVEAESRHHQAYETERQRLEGTETWRSIEPESRDAILAHLRIEKATMGAIGTEQEVLESVERISLDDWRTRTAALPQWFAEARAEADRLVEPTTCRLKLESITLRTPEDVKTWTRQTEQRLLEAVEHGPIVID